MGKIEQSQNSTPTRVYVVTVKSCQENKDDCDDVTDMKCGVLRIFAHKEDALKYMRDYYERLNPVYKGFKTDENSDGWFYANMRSGSTNPKGAISLEGNKLEDRIQKDVIECRVMDVSLGLGSNGITIEDDFYELFFG